MRKYLAITVLALTVMAILGSSASAKPAKVATAASSNCLPCVHISMPGTFKSPAARATLTKKRKLARAGCIACALNNSWELPPGDYGVVGGDGATISDPGLIGLIGAGDPVPSPCAGQEVCGDEGTGTTVTGDGTAVVFHDTNDSGDYAEPVGDYGSGCDPGDWC